MAGRGRIRARALYVLRRQTARGVPCFRIGRACSLFNHRGTET
jgi:hypothetical protein